MDFGFIKKVASDFSEDDCASMAAALAYYTAFALPPLLIVIITIAGTVWDPAAVSRAIEDQVGGLVGPNGAQQIKDMLHSADQSRKAPPMELDRDVLVCRHEKPGVKP